MHPFVLQISPSWSKVCEKLCKGRHQPLLLLYMNPNTDAVDVSSAPSFSTMAPGYEWKNEGMILLPSNRLMSVRPGDEMFCFYRVEQSVITELTLAELVY